MTVSDVKWEHLMTTKLSAAPTAVDRAPCYILCCDWSLTGHMMGAEQKLFSLCSARIGHFSKSQGFWETRNRMDFQNSQDWILLKEPRLLGNKKQSQRRTSINLLILLVGPVISTALRGTNCLSNSSRAICTAS